MPICDMCLITRQYGIVAQPKLLKRCLLLQTVAWYQCTRYLERHVPPALLSATRWMFQACPKIMNDWTIVCIFEQSLPLWSKQSNRSTLVLQAFSHLYANRWQVAVAARSSSREEIDEKTDQTNALCIQTKWYSKVQCLWHIVNVYGGMWVT